MENEVPQVEINEEEEELGVPDEHNDLGEHTPIASNSHNPPDPPQNPVMPPQSPINPEELSLSGRGGRTSLSGRGSSLGDGPKSTARTEALYLHAKVREMKLEDKRKEALQQENFHPEIATKVNIDITTSFHERQDEIQNRRHMKVQELAQLEETSFTGKPNLEKTAHINERVRSLLQGDEKVPVHQSLHLKSMERQERKAEYSQKLHQECTFRPQMFTEKSKFNTKIKDKLQKSVFDRLHDREKQKNKTLSNTQSSLEPECTFSPELATKSYPRPTTSSNNADGTPEGAQGPVHERLYNSAAKRRVKMDFLKQDQDRRSSEGCTFRPAINDPQKLLTRTGSKENMAAHDRLYLCADERRKREELYASLADSEYTFKPKLNAPKNQAVQEEANRLEKLYKIGVQKQTTRGPKISKTKQKGTAMLTRDADIHGHAEDLNADLRHQKEQEDLQECTFQPVLATKKGKRPVIQPPLTAERVDMEEALARGDSENLDEVVAEVAAEIAAEAAVGAENEDGVFPESFDS